MKGWITLTVALFIVIVLGVLALVLIPLPKIAQAPAPTRTATTTDMSDMIVVMSPQQAVAVASPLIIIGKARGSWYFEASFPIELKDASGAVIAQGHGQAQGDWMTTDFVPFTATLTFVQPAPGTVGTLILKNDNPSGDPANQKELDIPVQF